MERVSVSLVEIVERADDLYSHRANPESVRECVRLLNSSEIQEFEIAWRLGRAFFILGQEAEGRAEKKINLRRGVGASLESRSLCGERVEGHFWLGVNLALLAAESNDFNAARLAVKARKALSCAVAIDPGFHGAGPLRVLAKLEHKLPALMGGGGPRSRAHFEQAIDIAPT